MSMDDMYIQLVANHIENNKYHIELSYGSLSMKLTTPISRKHMKHNKKLLHVQCNDSKIFPVRKAPKEILDMFYKSVDEETITALVQFTFKHSDVRYRELCRCALNLIEEGLK